MKMIDDVIIIYLRGLLYIHNRPDSPYKKLGFSLNHNEMRYLTILS